jgi:hypothetical protein
VEVHETEVLIQFKGCDTRLRINLTDSSRIRPLQAGWEDEEDGPSLIVDGIVVDGQSRGCVYACFMCVST